MLDYESATSWQIGVRTADQIGHVFDKPFTIAVTDVYEGPFGFEPATFQLAAFTIGAGGWTNQNYYPRQLADVNGDGMADIVGFASGGVVVSLYGGWGQRHLRVRPRGSGADMAAQDYENDLDNREAMNALIAANVSIAGSRDSCRQALFA